jgi:hypothetical protein
VTPEFARRQVCAAALTVAAVLALTSNGYGWSELWSHLRHLD